MKKFIEASYVVRFYCSGRTKKGLRQAVKKEIDFMGK